jgi:2-haloacid dehalogenase
MRIDRGSRGRRESITIRPVERADAAEWLRLRTALWPEEDSAQLLADIAGYFDGSIRSPATVLVAADSRRRLVGMAELSIRPYAEGCSTDRVAFLEGWFVDVEMRFRGIGRALVDAALRWGESEGCIEFASDAELDNEASAAAHRALGFEETTLLRCFRKDLAADSHRAVDEPDLPADPVAAEVKVLAFDVFGTVVDWRSGIIDAATLIGRRRGIDADWPAFADAWRLAYGPSMDRVRRGELPWTKLDRLHRLSLDGLVGRFGLEALNEADRGELVHAWHRLPPWPDSAPGLVRLKRRFIIVTLSNGNLSLLTELAKAAELPWDCILSAELVRHYKPDPEAYRSVPEFFDLAANEVMMVAAHPGDLEAAAAAGLRTAYVHRPLEQGPDRPPARPEPGSFDLMASSFLELADRLGA